MPISGEKRLILTGTFLEFGDAAKLREDLKNRKEDYLIIGYSARLTLPQVFENLF